MTSDRQMETADRARTVPDGWRAPLHAAWLIVAGLSVVVLISSAEPRYRQLATVAGHAVVTAGQLLPEQSAALAQLGLTSAGYATYFTVLEFAIGMLFVTIGAFIFLRRRGERISLLFSLCLVTFGLISSPLPTALAASSPLWGALVLTLRIVGFASIVLAFLTFPDGRFVPAWTRWFAGLWILSLLISIPLPAARIPSSLAIYDARQALLILWAMFWFLFVAGIQVYRYRERSTPEQRQQTKWVVLGLSIAMGLATAASLLLVLLYMLHSPLRILMVARVLAFSVVLITGLFLGVAVAMAVIRHRLWEIDIIIRRTLAYTMISTIMAGVYLVLVVILQALFHALTGQNPSLAVALATMAIAALFNPLRSRIQRMIARRFNRHAYDATQALERFGQSMRHEVDLHQIVSALGTVLGGSMGPEQVSLWLAGPQSERRANR